MSKQPRDLLLGTQSSCMCMFWVGWHAVFWADVSVIRSIIACGSWLNSLQLYSWHCLTVVCFRNGRGMLLQHFQRFLRCCESGHSHVEEHCYDSLSCLYACRHEDGSRAAGALLFVWKMWSAKYRKVEPCKLNCSTICAIEGCLNLRFERTAHKIRHVDFIGTARKYGYSTDKK